MNKKVRDILTGKVKEKISTYTNLAYPILIIWQAWDAHWAILTYLTITSIAMGVGSALFHGTLVHKFQKMDEAVMYSFISSLIIWNIGSIWLIPVGLIISATMGLNHKHIPTSIGVGVLVFLNALSIGVFHGFWIWALWMIAGFLVALLIRQIGERFRGIFKITREREDFLIYDIFHGVWHIITAFVSKLSMII